MHLPNHPAPPTEPMCNGTGGSTRLVVDEAPRRREGPPFPLPAGPLIAPFVRKFDRSAAGPRRPPLADGFWRGGRFWPTPFSPLAQ